MKNSYSTIIENTSPLPVAREDKKLMGIIVRGSVLGALAIEEV